MGSGFAGKYENTYGANYEVKSYLFEEKRENVEILKHRESSVDANAERMKEKYAFDEEGFFGEKTKTRARVIKTKTPIEDSIDFYEKISIGGKRSQLKNGHGTNTILDDGTVITHRIVTSTKDSPAVDIHVYSESFIKTQKIHFTFERM